MHPKIHFVICWCFGLYSPPGKKRSSIVKIGVPKEIKNNEYRAGLVPGGVRQLVQDGHQLYVQAGCGVGVGISDQDYRMAGAEILGSLEEIYDVRRK